jgi:hypothetical protein
MTASVDPALAPLDVVWDIVESPAFNQGFRDVANTGFSALQDRLFTRVAAKSSRLTAPSSAPSSDATSPSGPRKPEVGAGVVTPGPAGAGAGGAGAGAPSPSPSPSSTAHSAPFVLVNAVVEMQGVEKWMCQVDVHSPDRFVRG